jgi:hypothetical protein
MTASSLDALIFRAARGAVIDKRRGRRRRSRPPFIAHPWDWWEPEQTAEHLAACVSGRDGKGEWKSWTDLTLAEKWAYFHEDSVSKGFIIGGEPLAIEVE